MAIVTLMLSWSTLLSCVWPLTEFVQQWACNSQACWKELWSICAKHEGVSWWMAWKMLKVRDMWNGKSNLCSVIGDVEVKVLHHMNLCMFNMIKSHMQMHTLTNFTPLKDRLLSLILPILPLSTSSSPDPSLLPSHLVCLPLIDLRSPSILQRCYLCAVTPSLLISL